MEPSIPSSQTQTPAPSPTPASSSAALIGGGVVTLLIIAGLGYWYMSSNSGVGELVAAPVQSNDSLSSSDETAAIEQDADEAYMQQLEADINADIQSMENY